VLEEFTQLIGLVLDMLSARLLFPGAFLTSCPPANLAPEDSRSRRGRHGALPPRAGPRNLFRPGLFAGFQGLSQICRAAAPASGWPTPCANVCSAGFSASWRIRPCGHGRAGPERAGGSDREGVRKLRREIEIDPRFITLVLLEARG
jgi:hypothetical protein